MTEQTGAVAAYFRIREQGPSRDEQERLAKEAARLRGLEIDEEFVDVAGLAAGDIVDRRMTLFEMLAEAQAGGIDTVIISSARAISDKPIEAALIAVMLERSKCRVIFADGFDLMPYREEATNVIEGRFGVSTKGER